MCFLFVRSNVQQNQGRDNQSPPTNINKCASASFCSVYHLSDHCLTCCNFLRSNNVAGNNGNNGGNTNINK